MAIEERLHQLSISLNSEFFTVLVSYVKPQKRQTMNMALNIVETYIGLLQHPIENSNCSELEKNLIHIRSHLCQNHRKTVVLQKLNQLYNLILLLIDKSVINGKVTLPDRPKSTEKYEVYRTQIIPANLLSKIRKNLSSGEEFDKTLSRTCPPEIAKRLKEHVYNFKMFKHHRNPLNEYLNLVFSENQKWYEDHKFIEGSLLKYRNNLLKKVSRNSAYSRYQNVKNAINVLIEHSLISNDTDLPDNLRRCTKTQKVRVDNPLLCATDIYDDRQKNLFRSTADFIEVLTNDINKNLIFLLEEAKKIVFKGYQKFYERNHIILKSEKSEFIKHPNLRISKKIKRINGVTVNIDCNPFSASGLSSSFRTNNLVAYFDHYYECFLTAKVKHNLQGIRLTKEVQSHLGLTALVASAMQIIIVEELGINPYSLYNVKAFSDGHGHEFVQVTDDGSVRLRALKLRARHVKTRKAQGALLKLIDIPEQEIDAATCLKMALEMTERARESTGKNNLWLCASSFGVITPTPNTFQSEFQKIRDKVSPRSKALKKATLKKVRSSKGLLIYLNSNGNSLKTASYFGNSVKTTLARYIPDYLTELVYRVKIRSFQNILLFMAIAHDESPADFLGLSPEVFKDQVTQALNNPDMGGPLYTNLKSIQSNHKPPQVKYFCVSLKNIMLALKYIKEGNEKNLKDDCMAAISKIAEGPIIMKQLLRKAEKSLNSIKEA